MICYYLITDHKINTLLLCIHISKIMLLSTSLIRLFNVSALLILWILMVLLKAASLIQCLCLIIMKIAVLLAMQIDYIGNSYLTNIGFSNNKFK